MERLPVNEKDVQNILRNKDKLKIDIHRKMYLINRDMSQNDEMYELVSYPSTEISDMPHRKGWHKDLSDVVLKYKVLLEKKRMNTRVFCGNLYYRKNRLIGYGCASWRLIIHPFL